MKMLVFERPFQQDLVEPCKPSNNFSRVPKVLSSKKCKPQNTVKICFTAYCAILYIVRYSAVCTISHSMQVKLGSETLLMPQAMHFTAGQQPKPTYTHI